MLCISPFFHTHTLVWQPINFVLGKKVLTSLCKNGHIKVLVSLIHCNVKNTLRLLLAFFINCFYDFYAVSHLTILLQWLHIMECSCQQGLMCTPRARLYLNSVHWDFALKAPSWGGAPQSYTSSSVGTWEKTEYMYLAPSAWSSGMLSSELGNEVR